MTRVSEKKRGVSERETETEKDDEASVYSSTSKADKSDSLFFLFHDALDALLFFLCFESAAAEARGFGDTLYCSSRRRHDRMLSTTPGV